METGENNRLINLPRETLNERILNILEELGQLDLEHFQWQLRQRVNLEGHDAIPKSRLENASTIATTDLIMQTYTNDAAQIMVNILNKIKRNDLLEKSPLMVPPFEMLHLPQPQTKKDLLKRCLHVYACVCVCLFVCVSVSVCVYMFVFAGNSTSSTPVPKNDDSNNGTLNIYIAIDIYFSFDEAKDAVTKLINKLSSFSISLNFEILFFSNNNITEIVNINYCFTENKPTVQNILEKLNQSLHFGGSLPGREDAGTNLQLPFTGILKRVEKMKEDCKEQFGDKTVILIFTNGGNTTGGSPKPTVDQIEHLVCNKDGQIDEENIKDCLGIWIVGDSHTINDETAPEDNYFRPANITNLADIFDNMIDVSDVPDNSGKSAASTAEPKQVCGVPAIKPVVSGSPTDGLGKEEAVPHSWPWQVSLQTWVDDGAYFDGSGYAEVVFSGYKISRIHLDVKLLSQDGVLVCLMNQDQFLCLAVIQGRMKVFYDLTGSLVDLKPKDPISPYLQISDGEKKSLEIIIMRPKRLVVRNNRQTMFNTDLSAEIPLFTGTYYLGGVPEDKMPSNLKSMITKQGSVKGCFRDVNAQSNKTAQSSRIDLKRMETSGVSFGCPSDLLDTHFCGGSLINKDWVVTTANCKVSTLHHVILGQHNLTHTDIEKIRIRKVFSHPKYNARTTDYDIALIKLQRPAQINDHVSPVCVAETRDNFYAGMKCVATGWGRTRYEPPMTPDKLQQVCLPLIGHGKCSSYFKQLITSQMLCAGGAGASTCHGDAGGPLVCEKNGAWTLVGVTSWGLPGCPTNMPVVYSSITALRAWMDQTMADN